jgi:hypothetical protein
LISTCKLVVNGARTEISSSGARVCFSAGVSSALLPAAGLLSFSTRNEDCPQDSTPTIVVASAVSDEGNSALWHRRYGHQRRQILPELHRHVDGVPPLSRMHADCDACLEAKMRRGDVNMPPIGDKAVVSDPLDLITSDVCGPIDRKSWGAGEKTKVYFSARSGKKTNFKKTHKNAG